MLCCNHQASLPLHALQHCNRLHTHTHCYTRMHCYTHGKQPAPQARLGMLGLIPQSSSLQIKGLLPRLGESGFIISPTQAQLAMMVREGGPAALKQVANFSVQHKVHGSIKWLEPVDVSALQLADLVIISRNNVDVSIVLNEITQRASHNSIYRP